MDPRQERFIDPQMYRDDAVYHAITDLLGDMLRGVEHAMKHEDVDPETIRRVINILLLGSPYGFEAQERINMQKHMLELIEGRQPGPLSRTFGEGADEGRT